MARPCRVCNHESRAAIEQAILNGKAASRIARDFGFTYTVRTGKKAGTQAPDHRIVTRHRDDHMGKAYQAAMEKREADSGNAIVNRLAFLDETVDQVIARAQEGRVLEVQGVPLLDDAGEPIRARDERLILYAVSQARENAHLALKLSGRTETDPAALERIRAGIQDPAVRKMLADLEARLASLDPANQPTE